MIPQLLFSGVTVSAKLFPTKDYETIITVMALAGIVTMVYIKLK